MKNNIIHNSQSHDFERLNELSDEINKWTLPQGWMYVGRKIFHNAPQLIDRIENIFINFEKNGKITIATSCVSEGLKHVISSEGCFKEKLMDKDYTVIEELRQNIFNLMESVEYKYTQRNTCVPKKSTRNRVTYKMHLKRLQKERSLKGD